MNLKKLAIIAKGTGRKKRDINLLKLSEEIKSLYNTYKSLNKVADLIKLSPEMIREFLKINDLEKEVKELIRRGLINSVDIGYRISKLSEKDQIIFARNIVEKKLSSKVVRAIIRYKLDNPKMPIEKAISKVIKSKDKMVYIVYLSVEKGTYEKILEKKREEIIASIFNNIIPKKYLISIEVNECVITLKVSKEGLVEVRNQAKRLKVPLAKVADKLVKEHFKVNK